MGHKCGNELKHPSLIKYQTYQQYTWKRETEGVGGGRMVKWSEVRNNLNLSLHLQEKGTSKTVWPKAMHRSFETLSYQKLSNFENSSSQIK